MTSAVGALAAASLLAVPLAAQKAAPAFEVASIKPNRTVGVPQRFQAAPGGRYTFTAYTLKSLVDVSHQRSAFDHREMVGGPPWIDTDRFDVMVKAEDGAVLSDPDGFPGPVFAMLRALLTERFGLVTHNEVRERPVYTLTLARAGHRLGAGLRPTGTDCAEAMRKLVAPLPGAAPSRDAPPCTFGGAPGRTVGNNVSLAMLASVLSSNVGRPVIDRTGVAGYFDFTLDYTPDVGVRGLGPATPQTGAAPAAGDAPSLFTALQEQLGLKLEATRAPVDVLVIDRATQPTEN